MCAFCLQSSALQRVLLSFWFTRDPTRKGGLIRSKEAKQFLRVPSEGQSHPTVVTHMLAVTGVQTNSLLHQCVRLSGAVCTACWYLTADC